jgi:DHA2 family multidrug resistance protein-like MFS transporter
MDTDNSVELNDPAGTVAPGEDCRHEGLPTPRRYLALAGVWLALIVSILDSSIANVALPTIARDLGASPADSIAIVSAFQLGVVISLLPMSALGEIITYRRVFIGGLFIFTLASLGCVTSHDLTELVVARAIQGIGGAGIMSVNGALAPRLLGAALGANALIIAAFGALGPTIASVMLALGPWQWLFAINLPVGALALALAWRALPESPKADRQLDLLSIVLNIIAFAMLLSGVDLVTRHPSELRGGAVLIGGVIAAAVLVNRCLSQSQPLVPIDLLRIRLVRLAALTSLSTFTAQTLTQVALPFYLQDGLHFNLVQIGLLMTPWPAGVALAAPLAGRLADRVSIEVLIGWGLFVMAAGLSSLLWLSPGMELTAIAIRMGVCGIGFGFFQSPNNRALLSSAPMHRSGAAAGLIAISRTVGQILGAMLVAIFFRLFGHVGQAAIGVSAIMAVLAALLGFARKSSGSHTVN